MPQAFDVATLGEPLVALVAEQPGPIGQASFRPHVTGAEVNVATALARLGHAVAFAGVLGDDAFAGSVARHLAAERISDAFVRRAKGTTGVLVRELRAFGPAEVIYLRSGSAGATLRPGDVAGAPEASRWLHVTGVTPALSASCRDAVAAAVAAARSTGIPVSLDVNYRAKLWTRDEARSHLAPLAEGCAVVFGDDDELCLLTGQATAAGAGAALFDHGVAQVVRKLGAAGAEALLPARAVRAPGHAVRVVDPVGAGDAFVAGYVSAILDGADPSAALARGNLCGAYAVSAVGDTTALPDRRRIELADVETLR